jgi:hypothetical protein
MMMKFIIPLKILMTILKKKYRLSEMKAADNEIE